MAGASLTLARAQSRPGQLLELAAALGPRPTLAAGLALTTLLPPTLRDLAALVVIILLGVPHGALDGELARTWLRPRLGVAWFGVFAAPYLALSALVLLGWAIAPLTVLALFLAVSVWHFGTEDTGSVEPLVVLGAGGLPVALAVLAHPAATAAIFGTVTQVRMMNLPAWLTVASVLWVVPASFWFVRLAREGDRARIAAAVMLAASAILLPPLTSFAIYFVCVHAPAHVRSLIADRRLAPRITDATSAARLSLPVTALTLVLGAALWPLFPGEAVPRLLGLTLQGLAALTLPHMLFERWLNLTAAGGRSLPEIGHGTGSRWKSGTVAPL